MISSHQRCQRTVLSTELCDAVAVPTVQPEVLKQQQARRQQLMQQREREQKEREEEEALGSPSKRTPKSAPNNANSASTNNTNNTKNSTSTDTSDESDTLYIVAKYPSKQMPQRDVQFLEKFQAVLVNGLSMAAQRAARQQQREGLLSSLATLRDSPVFTNDVYIQVCVHGLFWGDV